MTQTNLVRIIACLEANKHIYSYTQADIDEIKAAFDEYTKVADLFKEALVEATENVHFYTDGACSSNPGPGGWAFAEVSPHFNTEEGIISSKSGFVDNTTNNQMELQAILMAISLYSGNAKIVHIYTDSKNAIGWLSGGWKRNNPNIKGLCESIEKITRQKGLTLKFEYVEGHSSSFFNNFVDELAVKEYKNRQ